MFTIMIDMDGTLTDTMGGIVDDLNNNYRYQKSPSFGRLLDISEITDYGFTNFSEIQRRTLLYAFSMPGRHTKVKAYPHAVDVIRRWINQPEKFKVKFVSHWLPDWRYAYQEKVEWLRNDFTVDIDSDFIMCKNRNNLIWDVLIDDCLDNVFQCSRRACIIPSRPWNHVTSLPAYVYRKESWLEIAEVVRNFTE